MSEEFDLNVLDNLNIDTESVDTSRPYLPPGTYPFNIKDISVVPSKNAPGNKNLKVDFVLADAVEAANGVPVNPGFPLSKYYPLQQSPKANAPKFEVDIAVLIESALGVKAPLSSEVARELIGKTVGLTLKVTQSEQYGTGNEIARVKAL